MWPDRVLRFHAAIVAQGPKLRALGNRGFLLDPIARLAHIRRMDLPTFLARRGAIASLATALGVTHTTVMRWRDGRVPVEHLSGVSAATGIPVSMLRPDLAAIFAGDATHTTARDTADA